MAHTISALRQYKQSEKRRARNHSVKSELRTQMKKVLAAVDKKDATLSKTALSEAYALLDRAVGKQRCETSHSPLFVWKFELGNPVTTFHGSEATPG